MHFHYNLLSEVSTKLLMMIAVAGGAEDDYFDKILPFPHKSTLRSIMYPIRDTKDVPKKAFLPDGKIISTPPHADSGIVTLLQTFDNPGLELKLGDNWYQVPVVEDCLVVNVGEVLTKMSGGRFRSTIHRVMDIGRDRFSMPFFFEPNFDFNLNSSIPQPLLPKVLNEENLPNLFNAQFNFIFKGFKTSNDYIPYGAYILKKLQIYAEWATLLDNLPDWMLEKYIRTNYEVSHWAKDTKEDVDGVVK